MFTSLSLRIDLPVFFMATPGASQMMQLEPNGSKDGIGDHRDGLHGGVAFWARLTAWLRLAFQHGHSLFECCQPFWQGHKGFPAGNCIEDFQHV